MFISTNEKCQFRILFLMLIMLFFICCAFAEEPVNFACPKLKARIEGLLHKKDPTPNDMLDLKSFSSSGLYISSIKGLEYATNLEELSLSDYQGIENGSEKWLRINDIPCLSNLVNLKKLRLCHIKINDMSILSKLTNSESIDLQNNDIEDISILKDFKNLKFLYISRNNIKDISALKGLTNLYRLSLEDNAIEDISPLKELHNLGYVNLRYNPLSKESIKTHRREIRKSNPKLKKFDIYPHGATGYWKRTGAGVFLAYLFISLTMPILLVLCVFNRRKELSKNEINNPKPSLLNKLFRQVDVIMAFILLLYLLANILEVNFLYIFSMIELRIFEGYFIDQRHPEEFKNTGKVIYFFLKLFYNEGILGDFVRTYWLAEQIGWIFVPLFLFKKCKSWFLKFGIIAIWTLVNVWHLGYQIFYSFMFVCFSFGSIG